MTGQVQYYQYQTRKYNQSSCPPIGKWENTGHRSIYLYCKSELVYNVVESSSNAGPEMVTSKIVNDFEQISGEKPILGTCKSNGQPDKGVRIVGGSVVQDIVSNILLFPL